MASKNKISYTNKDAASIFSELVQSIPLLTDKWKNYADDDPGIVLLKLGSFIGDMLCYNIDFQVNETFPQTATQRKNCQKNYDLIGYKMHWYRSAECTVRMTFTRPDNIPLTHPITVVIPEFTELLTPDKISYVIIGNTETRTITLSSNQSIVSKDFVAIQGIGTRQLNITADRIIRNGRIYVEDVAIEEDTQNDPNYAHMRLQTYDSATNLPLDDGLWTKVSNLLDIKEEGRYYELRVDDNNQPYIQLCDNYLDYISQTNNYLGLSYIISNGVIGTVAENIGFTFNTAVNFIYNGSSYNFAEYVSISNTQSSQGKNPETNVEAAKNAAKEARTLGVAITLSDYEILCKTADGIRACHAVDYSTDVGTQVTNEEILLTAIYNNFVLKAPIPNMMGYIIDPYSLELTVTAGAESFSYYDDGSGALLNSSTDERVYASHINYFSGLIELDTSDFSTINSISDVTSVTVSYLKKYAPYVVVLKLIANDFGYVPDYSKEILDEIFQNKTVTTVRYFYENASAHPVPFNIGIYAYEPWNSSDPSLTNYISQVVNDTLTSYFNSSDRNFGETLSYPNLCIEIQNSDTKIKLADLYYPTRNYKLQPDEYPRLGPVAVNLSDNANFVWMLENLFEESVEANNNYNTLTSAVFDGILNANSNFYEITGPLTLVSSATVDGEDLPITWWCSRPDLIEVSATNQTIWGNLTYAKIIEDTPVVLYAIVHRGDAEIVLAEAPVELTLKKYEE